MGVDRQPAAPAAAPAPTRVPARLDVLRGVGNRAFARWAATSAGRSLAHVLAGPRFARGHGRLLQRVGEQKVGYRAREGAPEPALKLLKEAFAEVKQRRKDLKDKLEGELRTKLAALKDDPKKDEAERKKLESQRKQLVMTEYPAGLKLRDWALELEDTKPFKDGELKLAGGIVSDKEGKAVASLTRGAAMFEAVPNPAGGGRTTYVKPGEPRIYVADDRDVQTRRYAYLEKSIYQFMELARSSRLSGRFQRIHAELGLAEPDVLAIKSDLRKKLNITSGGLDAPIVRLAVLHQWMGSGMQQRGLSLTSTPREEAVYSNAAESFRSEDGVRITIDLAKVPKTVKLINHYSARGIKDLIDSSGWVGSGFGGWYNYAASVVKNREVYLERLEPEWIEAIEVHGAAIPAPASPLKGAALLAWVAEKVGYARYLEGYRDALEPPATPPASAADPIYVVGRNAGEAYRDGYEAGKAFAGKPPQSWWNSIEDLFLASDEKLKRKEDYWVGVAHAAAGKQRGAHVGIVPKPVVTPTLVAVPKASPAKPSHAKGPSRRGGGGGGSAPKPVYKPKTPAAPVPATTKSGTH